MQRVMMNLGIGLGGLVGGLVATTANPTSFQVLFLGDAATFLVYSVFLLRVPAPARTPRPEGRERGGYGEVVRNRVFMAVVALNFVFIGAGMAQARDAAGLREERGGRDRAWNRRPLLSEHPGDRARPAADGEAARGHRRMRTLAVLGVVWAVGLSIVPIAGIAADAWVAWGFPRSDLRDHRCRGMSPRNRPGAARRRPRRPQPDRPLHERPPSLGASDSPSVRRSAESFWASRRTCSGRRLPVCLAAGAAALALERSIPVGARTTPKRAQPALAES